MWFRSKSAPLPSIVGHDVRALVRQAWPACHLYMSDGDATDYACIDPADAWRWMQKGEPHLYQVPLWDCDDIALAAMIAARRWGRDKAKMPPAFGVAFRAASTRLPGHYFGFFIGLDVVLHTLDQQGRTMDAQTYGHPFFALA